MKKNSWLLIFLILVLAAGLGYLIFRSSQQLDKEISNSENQPLSNLNQSINTNTTVNSNSTNINSNINTNSAITQKDKQISTADYRLTYPSTWSVEQSDAGGIQSYNFKSADGEANFSVMSSDMQGLVEDSLSIEEESALTISGQTAKKLKGGDLKDGSLIISVILVKDGILYNFSGRNEDILDELIANFSFI